MLELINNFGFDISTESWDKAAALPYYFSNQYDFKRVIIDGTPCLFAEVLSDAPTIQMIQKHIARIRETEALPVVLKFKSVSSARRKMLISKHIPFVAEGQAYLPFMGVSLSKKLYSEAKPNEKLMPSSQMLLFAYIYQHSEKMYVSGLSDKFGFSTMQLTRAARQLCRLNLLDMFKDGVHLVLRGQGSKQELFENAAPFLINPVREVLFIPRAEAYTLPLSGVSALSHHTMLYDDAIPTFAHYSRNKRLIGENALTDRDSQAQVELWKYSPTALSEHDSTADLLSVAVSLNSENDPRVEQAIESALERIWS